MRIPTLFVLAITGVALGLGFTAGYYVAVFNQDRPEILLVGAIALGVLTWLGSGTDLMGFLRDLWNEKKTNEARYHEKMRRHTLNLKPILERLLDVEIHKQRDGSIIKEVPNNPTEYRNWLTFHSLDDNNRAPRPNFIDIEKLPYLDRVLSHLQGYPEINEAWKKRLVLVEEAVAVEKNLYNKLDVLISSGIQTHLPSLIPHEQEAEERNFYILRNLVQFYLDTFYYYNKYQELPKFQHLKKQFISGRWYVQGYEKALIVSDMEDDTNPKILERVLLDLSEDKELMHILTRHIELAWEEPHAAEETFCNYLKELIQEIEDIDGEYEIQGRCIKCPPRND